MGDCSGRDDMTSTQLPSGFTVKSNEEKVVSIISLGFHLDSY